MNAELRQIERLIAQLNRRIETLWWKCVWLQATAQDYAELKLLQQQVNGELEKRNILIENLHHEESILKENGQ